VGDVVRRDFGKEDREAARAFVRLLKIALDAEDEILANPGKYLAMASEKLAEAEQFKARLYDALHMPWVPKINYRPDAAPTLNDVSTVTVDLRDYEALQALRQIIDGS
jgi:hypothetical protein